MKAKFDTTTLIVSETLAKYGFKLDSSGKLLIAISDSNRLIPQASPILGLCYEPCYGIEVVERNVGNRYKLKITYFNQDAGASFFKISTKIILEDSSGNRAPTQVVNNYSFLTYESKVSANTFVVSERRLGAPFGVAIFYFWIKGTYKRIDGS